MVTRPGNPGPGSPSQDSLLRQPHRPHADGSRVARHGTVQSHAIGWGHTPFGMIGFKPVRQDMQLADFSIGF